MSPTNPTPQRILGAALTALIALATAGAALAECSPGQLQEASRMYLSAAEFLKAQQYDQAIARLKSIASVCPEHIETNRGLGAAYGGKGDWAQAAKFYERVVELRGETVEAGDFANLARAYAKQKKFKEARAEFMKAEMLAPEDCGVLFNLGLMHYAAGYYTQSVDVLQHALDSCERVREPALKQLAKSANAAAKQQRSLGNSAKAEFYADLALEYGGAAGGSTTYGLVKQKMDERKYDEAIELLEQMLERNPDQPNALLTLARAQDASGRKTASIAAYRRYLALKPDNTEEIGSMLHVMVEAGQAEQARVEAAAAYREHQDLGRLGLAPILFSWGLALEQTGEFAEAKAKFAECAASSHDKYASPARTYVERMEGLIAQQAAQRKRAGQGG